MMDRPKAGQQRRSEVDENAKELHMFVWSANASPISESLAGAGSGQLHVFGGCEFNTSDYAREYDAKEVRILVHSHSDHHQTPNAGVSKSSKPKCRSKFYFITCDPILFLFQGEADFT
jgi:hypothetical protein